MPFPIIQDELLDSSTEDSFMLYRNMQRLPNIPMPVFKEPTKRIFSRLPSSVARVRKSEIQLNPTKRKSLICSTPMNPTSKAPIAQVSPMQLSPITNVTDASENKVENGKTHSIKNGLLATVSGHPQTEVEFRMSKSYDAEPQKKIKPINTSVRNVVAQLNREIAKRKRKSIGIRLARKSVGVLKENTTVTNQTTNSQSTDSRTATEINEKNPTPSGFNRLHSNKTNLSDFEGIGLLHFSARDNVANTAAQALESIKSGRPSRKTVLMERETQTTDSLTKALQKPPQRDEEDKKVKKKLVDVETYTEITANRSKSQLNKSSAACQTVVEPVEASVPNQEVSPTDKSNKRKADPHHDTRAAEKRPKALNKSLQANQVPLKLVEIERLKQKSTNKEQQCNAQQMSTNQSEIQSNSSQTSLMLRSSPKTTLNDALVDDFLEKFDVTVHMAPSIITISSASEFMSPEKTYSDSQEEPPPNFDVIVNQHENNSISHVHPRNADFTLIQSQQPEKSSKNKSPNEKNTSNRNISYNTRSVVKNHTENDTSANTSKSKLETVNEKSPKRTQKAEKPSNIAPAESGTFSKQKNAQKSAKSTKEDNAVVTKQSVSEMQEPENVSTEDVVKSTANTKKVRKTAVKRSKKSTVVLEDVAMESDDSEAPTIKSRQTGKSQGRKTKSRVSRNSGAGRGDKRKNSKSISAAGARKSKASTSKVPDLQPYFLNRVSGFIQIEHNHPTLNFISDNNQGTRRSQRPRKEPARYIQSTMIGQKPKTRRTSQLKEHTIRKSVRPKTSSASSLTTTIQSNIEISTAESDVFKKPAARSSRKKQKRNTSGSTSASNKPTSTTQNETNQPDSTCITKTGKGIDSGTFTMSKEISTRCITVTPLPSCSHWNDDAPMETVTSEHSQETVDVSPNVVVHENVVVQPIQRNLEETVLHAPPSHTNADLPKINSQKSVTFSSASLPASRNQFARTLFPPCVENNSEMTNNDGNQPKTDKAEHNENTDIDGKALHSIVNNQVVALEWLSKMPSTSPASEDGVTVTYMLKNLKTAFGISSCGTIKFDAGQQRVQVTKKHCIVYKVEQGQATVRIQLLEENLGVGRCFHIPLGSTYSISNNKAEPLILYFTKTSA